MSEKRSLLSTLAKEPRKKITKCKNKNLKCDRKNCYEVYTMANVKITERDIYNSIIAKTIDQDVLVEFAEKKLAQLDRRNATAAKRAAAKRAESDALLETVFSVLSEEPMNREKIMELVAETVPGVKLGQITNRLSRLAADGRVYKAKDKYKDEENKSHEQTVYTVA